MSLFNYNDLESKTHSVSLADVRNYLASLSSDRALVGIANHVDDCLIARTLRWKYKVKHVGVFDFNTHAIVGPTEEWVSLGNEVTALANDFDAIGHEVDKHQNMVPVRRRFFYARHPELRLETHEI